MKKRNKEKKERVRDVKLEYILQGQGPKFPDWALALSKYIEWTEEEQVVVGGPNLKSHY